MEQNEDRIHPGPWGEFPDKYWAAYFVDDVPYYMTELRLLRDGHRLDFRWVVFFFNIYWILYRKMYVVALCFVCLLMLESTIADLLITSLFGYQASIWMNLFWLLASRILMSIYANRVYLWDARRNIRIAMQENPGASDAVLVEAIRKRGGTSTTTMIVAMVLLVFFSILSANIGDAFNSIGFGL